MRLVLPQEYANFFANAGSKRRGVTDPVEAKSDGGVYELAKRLWRFILQKPPGTPEP